MRSGYGLAFLLLRHGLSSTCPRSCENFEQGIVVMDHHASAQAGLGDRAFGLSSLGNLATSLCAKAVYPPPGVSLTMTHNYNNYDSKPHRVEGAKWERYLQTRRYKDKGDFLLQDVYPGDVKEPLLHYYNFDVVLWTHKRDTFADDYLKAYTASMEGSRFIWWISIHYWREWPRGAFDREVVTKLGHSPKIDFYINRLEHCSYVSVTTGLLPMEIATAVLDSIGVKDIRDVAVLHIRRGDMLKACNTSIPFVFTYLSCSGFANVETRDVILLSDEVDTDYRDSVVDMITKMPRADGRTWKVYDGDALILQKTREMHGAMADDNYVVYAAGAYMIGDAGHSFATRCPKGKAPQCGEHRRCHPCAHPAEPGHAKTITTPMIPPTRD
mmetsp:Transcript_15976/g.50081  ORF Transcript_15976/g.50081 Transcript_15976/m.50081 type:complete len:384 (-) Transcript_15976:149-1300(-)